MEDFAELARIAADVPARTGTGYPAEFAPRLAGRSKRVLGDLFGIGSFGVNLVTLPPGAQSSLRHRHTVQDEFVYVLSGEAVLVHDDGETPLSAGMCSGFRHGGTAHHLVNRSELPVEYLEVGDRLPGDGAEYPDDDLMVERVDGSWLYRRRSGEPL